MQLRRGLLALAVASLGLPGPANASGQFEWHWKDPLQPCGGQCAVMAFVGASVASNVQDIFFKAIPPWSWQFGSGGVAGGAASRKIATLFSLLDIEGELGIAKRFGDQHETEFWEAIYVRYSQFPWNKIIYTTFAVSTGISYATGVSEFEKEHSKLDPPDGTRIQHYFSPELTFALPEHKDRQLVLRLHHRSGAYNIISRAASGSTYLAVGLRLWF
jgi:hypothetical protein